MEGGAQTVAGVDRGCDLGISEAGCSTVEHSASLMPVIEGWGVNVKPRSWFDAFALPVPRRRVGLERL